MDVLLMVAFLASLMKLVDATGKVWTCVGIHALGALVITLLFGTPWQYVLVGVLLEALWAIPWFYALASLERFRFPWFTAVIAGLAARTFMPDVVHALLG